MITNIEASYRRDRLCLGKELPLDMPLSLIIDISEKCNFRCSYCFRAKERDESWDYAAKNNLMPADSFREIIRQLSAFPGKIKSISLSGHGEPLCNPDIIDMVHALCAANVTERIEMHTNASLLTAKTAEEIAKAGLEREINQYFAALTNMRSVGVMGDERTYDYAIALRAVKTVDFMTAEAADIPFAVLQKIMSRIINEVKGVNRVFYDLTSKPPGTIEFE